jgi:hypothetical protein
MSPISQSLREAGSTTCLCSPEGPEGIEPCDREARHYRDCELVIIPLRRCEDYLAPVSAIFEATVFETVRMNNCSTKDCKV